MESKRGIEKLSFDKHELEVIRELLSQISCAYEREKYYYHCCDANEIIEKIDGYLNRKTHEG